MQCVIFNNTQNMHIHNSLSYSFICFTILWFTCYSHLLWTGTSTSYIIYKTKKKISFLKVNNHCLLCSVCTFLQVKNCSKIIIFLIYCFTFYMNRYKYFYFLTKIFWMILFIQIKKKLVIYNLRMKCNTILILRKVFN